MLSLLNKSVFVGTVCGVESYNKCSKCSLSALKHAHNRFATHCFVDNTLFEVSPDIGCSGCQVATFVMEARSQFEKKL